MPFLVLHNGNRFDVDSAESVDGKYVVRLPGGNITIPANSVKRVEGGKAPPSREPMAAMSKGWTPSPDLGRPTADYPPFGEPPIPLSLPPNDLDLGFRSDQYDFERAARDAAGIPDREASFRRLADSFNEQRRDWHIDSDESLRNWRRYWTDIGQGPENY